MKQVLLSFAFLLGAVQVSAAVPESLSPYAVVVPSINGDPASTDRVSGQLYFDVSAQSFKGIDNTGAVKVFNTGSSAAKVTPSSSPSINPTTYITIPFTTSDTQYDTGSYVGTNQFTVPRNGIYTITALAISSVFPSPESHLILQYSVNGGAGVQLCMGFVYNTSGITPWCSGSDQAKLNAGDTVQFLAAGTAGTINPVRLMISAN
jgi:hypothetical protein